MADWYVSSTSWASVPAFQASHVYSVGDFVRPSVHNFGIGWVARVTVGGTSGTEPNWNSYPFVLNNGTITSGPVTFQNVSGQSQYGWGCALGDLYTICAANGNALRPVVGDRVFISSDHSETYSGGGTIWYHFQAQTGFYYGLVEVFSVNKAGSGLIPPIAADLQQGASFINNGSQTGLDCTCDIYWHGCKFINGISGANSILFAQYGSRILYFKNCLFQLTSTASAPTLFANSLVRLIFDNTVMQFGNNGQFFGNARACEIVWINTQYPVQGSVPTQLFINNSGFGGMSLLARGVDFSAVTGQLYAPQGWPFKMLLDSCVIASGLTRYPASPGAVCSQDEIELVNCWDGTNVINERWTSAGSTVSDRSVYLVSGAVDDTGAFSFKLVSSGRADALAMPVTAFQLDVENTLTGSRTASVEVLSATGLLNTNDIALLLEYEGTSGSTIASFAESSGGALAVPSSLPTSSGVWNNQPSASLGVWNSSDRSGNINLSNGNLTATPSTSADGGVRANNGITAGKVYFEVAWATPGASFGCGVCTGGAPLTNGNSTNYVLVIQDGRVWINNSNVFTLGTIGSGVVCFALDMTAMQVWCRLNGGNWNASGTANPATGVGGANMAPIGTPPFFPVAAFNALGSAATANFGASAFAFTVPTGFASVNSFYTVNKQTVQVPFTPQNAGRLRGLMRLMKPNATVWINPQITVV